MPSLGGAALAVSLVCAALPSRVAEVVANVTRREEPARSLNGMSAAETLEWSAGKEVRHVPSPLSALLTEASSLKFSRNLGVFFF